MIKTNKEKLVMQSVSGKIHHPTMRSSTKVDHAGVQFAGPAVGGICYNVKIGDSVFDWAGDHIEPGVSLQNSDASENLALNFLSCIGNVVKVTSGDAKGAIGRVTGTHGGIEHVLADFGADDLEKMNVGDSMLIKAFGQGLKIEGFDKVKVMNIDPEILEKMNISIDNGKLVVPVSHIVPAHLMGSGIGSANAFSGDYDIMTMDKREIEKFNLQNLRFGDIVFIKDADTTFGRGFRKGAGTVGVVVHSDCVLSGHGPGVTTILTSQTSQLVAKLDKNANITKLF